MVAGNWPLILKLGQIYKFDWSNFLIFGLVFVSCDFDVGTVHTLRRVDRQSHTGVFIYCYNCDREFSSFCFLSAVRLVFVCFVLLLLIVNKGWLYLACRIKESIMRMWLLDAFANHSQMSQNCSSKILPWLPRASHFRCHIISIVRARRSGRRLCVNLEQILVRYVSHFALLMLLTMYHLGLYWIFYLYSVWIYILPNDI